MPRKYSTYEAKSKFSEILRQVREGGTVYVTYRGEEVAEIRPISGEPSTESALRRLEQSGVLDPARPRPPLRPIERRPGGLKRFLESRDE